MPVNNRQNITIRKVTFQTFHTIKDEMLWYKRPHETYCFFSFFIHNIGKFNVEFLLDSDLQQFKG